MNPWKPHWCERPLNFHKAHLLLLVHRYPTRAVFLSLGTTEIWGHIIIFWWRTGRIGRSPKYFRMCRSILGVYPLNTSCSQSSTVTAKNVCRHSQMSPEDQCFRALTIRSPSWSASPSSMMSLVGGPEQWSVRCQHDKVPADVSTVFVI